VSVRSASRSAVRRVQGTLTILRTLRGQHRVPYLPPERLHELRDQRVRETVLYAAEYVPFYRDHFRRERIDPRELRSADDLAQLPLLDKASVHGRLDRFRSHAFRESEVVSVKTSGRSGAWLEVWHDRRSLLAGIAYSERERAVEAHFAGRHYRYPVLEIRAADSSVQQVQRVYRGASFRPLRPRVYLIAIETPTEEVVGILNRKRPAVLRTYGSYADVFFRVVDAEQLDVVLPRVVAYAGDAMSAPARAFVEERFGVPVLSRYGAVEAPRIGFFCEERSGFHLNEDIGHVRLVTPDGRDAPAGEVVISNLVNRGCVLLNYRLGDFAHWVDGPCACGRTLRRIGDLEGRVAEVLRLDGGRLVHQYAIWHALTSIAELVNFQLVQVEPQRFELRLQPASRGRYEHVAGEAAARVRRLLPDCVVDPAHAAQLDLERRNGKLERIVPLPGR
jgi:phenylacetate-coenzyme A ligase PaaK-like adenylate-forming protein